MKMNFFENISTLNAPGIWKIGIHQVVNGQFVVSALYTPEQSANTSKTITPLILKGTAEELGDGFFEAIEQPVQLATGLYTNLAEYAKSIEAAKKRVQPIIKTSLQKGKSRILTTMQSLTKPNCKSQNYLPRIKRKLMPKP